MDFWGEAVAKFISMTGRDWETEKKLRKLGISPRFLSSTADLYPKQFTRKLRKAFNKRKKQRRATTGRRG